MAEGYTERATGEDRRGRSAFHFSGEYGVGVMNTFSTFVTSGPSFSEASRAAIHAGSSKKRLPAGRRSLTTAVREHVHQRVGPIGRHPECDHRNAMFLEQRHRLIECAAFAQQYRSAFKIAPTLVCARPVRIETMVYDHAIAAPHCPPDPIR